MYNALRSLLIILCLVGIQVLLYHLFLKPTITTWGASKEDVMMAMAGDDKTHTIVSTRAILINAPKHDVWKCLTQLGADRNGFYSYTFLEELMGYKTRHHSGHTPEPNTISVGDIVRGSIDEKSSIIPYNFKVLYVKPEETFVLDQWGTFLLKQVNPRQTRLIIRTQEIEAKNFQLKFANYIIVSLHYIMERRTLMGIKDCAESYENTQLSSVQDIFWFIGIILSAIMLAVYIFMVSGFMQSLIFPLILSTMWSLTVLIFTPIPVYSIGLLFFVCLAICIHRKKD